MTTDQIIEKRKEPRFSFPAQIVYELSSESTHSFEKGVILNISCVGASMYVFRNLREDNRLTIKTELPWKPDTGYVKWIRQIDGDLYQIGISFTNNLQN
jgi:hypothetical protein